MRDSITYVGMDVHKNTYSVCCYSLADDKVKLKSKFNATTKNVLQYLEKARELYPKNSRFICGYEAGYSGYAIYRELEKYGVECKVLAPSTITNIKNRRVKTDARDCENIARSMALNTASEVFVLDEKDENVREFLRMRDDHKNMLKRNKQQILFLLHRQNMKYTGGPKYWTHQHILWLNALKFEDEVIQETFEEYLTTYYYLVDKIKRFDRKIEEISQDPRYKERSDKLQCFLGIKTHTAMSCLVEIGDFNRFRKPNNFAAFLGFTPSEYSSGEKIKKGQITKSGNQNLRKLLTESAQCYTKGRIGYKSKCIIDRQSKCTPDVIAYADKANERLRRKFYRLTLSRGMNHNKAKTAIARELCCFIWGMMTDNIAV